MMSVLVCVILSLVFSVYLFLRLAEGFCLFLFGYLCLVVSVSLSVSLTGFLLFCLSVTHYLCVYYAYNFFYVFVCLSSAVFLCLAVSVNEAETR